MAKYTPRTTAPSSDSKYWKHTSAGGMNPCLLIGSGSVLPNCVGYAWGRFAEITGTTPTLSRANAEDWWKYTQDGYKRGQVPKLGAVCVWEGAGSAAGHVAIVEEVKENGDIVTSNSGYGGPRFYTQTVTKASGYQYKSDGSRPFLGFIYSPIEFDESGTSISDNGDTDVASGSKYSLGEQQFTMGKVVKPTSVGDLNISGGTYNGYVDPDFYVFYPFSYLNFEKEAQAEGETCYDLYEPKQRTDTTRTITKTNYNYSQIDDDGDETSDDGNGLIEQFISICEKQLGKRYVWGNVGPDTFDCTGLPTYALRQMGIIPSSVRFTTSTICGGSYEKYLKKVDKQDRKRGDLMVYNSGNQGHCIIYKGGDKCIEAKGKEYGVVNSSYKERVTGKYECYRVIAFENNNTNNNNPSSSGNTVVEKVTSYLRQNGFTDIAIAGILGNMYYESGVNPANVQGSWRQSNPDSYNNDYVKKVDNGTISRYDFAHNGPGGSGFGLVQFTYYSYKEQLYDKAKSKGVSVANVDIQCEVLCSQINGLKSKLNSASSAYEAAKIFLLEYERPKDQSTSVQNKRGEKANEYYSEISGKEINNNDNNDGNNSSNYIHTSELKEICQVVMGATQGMKPEAEKAIAQLIYDRFTSGKGTLSMVIGDRATFPKVWTGELNKTVEASVKSVFCDNKKPYADDTLLTYLGSDSLISNFKINDKLYDRMDEETGSLTFWGKEGTPGSTKTFTISDTYSSASTNTGITTTTENVTHKACNLNLNHFAMPVLFKTDAMIYDKEFNGFWNDDKGLLKTGNSKQVLDKNELNKEEFITSSAFVDEHQYGCRGRLVRAFPAYLFCILDDQSQWYRGDKLWTNYYTHKSVVDIQVHGTNDMPTETATVVISNIYHNLDRTQGGVSGYTLKDDPAYADWFNQTWIKWTGHAIGIGPKLTDKLIELHQIIYDHAKLREGARVHLRMGYGSDPLSLAPVMNGFISDLQVGDLISMVVTSDGSELIQNITSSNQNDVNKGFLGLFGLFEDQESSNIIANILCKRQGWFNYIIGDTYEGSKYAIEHYGLYFDRSLQGAIIGYAYNILDSANAAYEDTKDFVGIPIIGEIAGGIAWLASAHVNTIKSKWSAAMDLLKDIYDGYAEQYDIMKNVYKANYERVHYIYSTVLDVDGEPNVVFNKYNMTPWDVMQVCTQQVPEYILKSTYHQFDSRIYFGLPFWMEKYRYDYLGNIVYEECKSASQVHLLDSLTNIVDDQIKVTNKFSPTNMKVMYTLGGGLGGKKSSSTKVIHSDDTIDYSKQSTKILDTPITQDALGPDAIYEFLGYDIGKESARRTGISNLLYGWQQQYQGQIICTGMPGVKAHDYLMVYDTFVNIMGLSIAREVVHSFSTNTGFTTSITPGMIGFSTDEDSGMIESTENFLNILTNFTSYLEIRRHLKDNYESTLCTLAAIEVCKEKLATAVIRQQNIEFVQNSKLVVDWAVAGLDIWAAIKVTKSVYNFVKAGKLVAEVTKTFKAVKTAGSIAKGISAIKAGGTAIAAGAAPESAGLSLVVWLIVATVVDILLNDLLEWLSNKNVCVLLPMWYEGYPLVSGVKDGTKILLCGSNADATNESAKTDQGSPDWDPNEDGD